MPDIIKWLAAIALLAAGVAGFYQFGDHSLLLRVVALLVLGAVAIAIVVQTERGRVAWGFVRDARTEVRKVVWPTRRETLQTSGIVIAMVSIVAVFLWGLDGVLAFVMRQLFGHGG